MISLHFYSLILVVMTSQHCLGCFHDVKPLMTSSEWLQATSMHSYLRYVLGSQPNADTMFVIPRHQTSGKMTLKCLQTYSNNRVLVEKIEPQTDGQTPVTTFQCLGFKSLSRDLVRLEETAEKSSKDEVNCETSTYSSVLTVLIAQTISPRKVCPLRGSYQAMLHNSRDSSSFCEATFRFQCNIQRVMVTFWSNCKPPVFNYYRNKPRYQRSIYLDCVGGWSEGENTNIVVLRKKDNPVSFWCLHYSSINGNKDFVSAYISFDGKCDADAFKAGFTKVKDSMYGTVARFLPRSHPTCSDKHTISHCTSNSAERCSETNECPSKCKRCFKVPKMDNCKFSPSAVGQWKSVSSDYKLKVDIDEHGVKSSTNGMFSCKPEMKKKYAYPIVQYDKSGGCMPLYACVQMFNPAPGVLNFNLRPSITDERSGEPLDCQETDSFFQKHPYPEGEMITLVDLKKLQESPCDFGTANQFPTTSGDCLLNVADCSGNCQTLNVSFDNSTCQETSPGLILAKEHRCQATLKFQDRVRGLLTYSEVLDKYFCWVFTSSRLFVMEPYKCNTWQAVTKGFSDKYAAEKYDPIRAFTVQPLTEASRGTSTPHSQTMVLYGVFGLFSVLLIKSLL